MIGAVIKQLEMSELASGAEIVRESFGTVARDFNLTPENAPTNGAFTRTEHLEAEYRDGCLMYGLFVDGAQVGFMELRRKGDDAFELKKIGVRPPFRHRGYGGDLLRHARETVKNAGGKKIVIGIIEENTILKNWYLANGFVGTGTRRFPHLPFTVGFMEYDV